MQKQGDINIYINIYAEAEVNNLFIYYIDFLYEQVYSAPRENSNFYLFKSKIKFDFHNHKITEQQSFSAHFCIYIGWQANTDLMLMLIRLKVEGDRQRSERISR